MGRMIPIFFLKLFKKIRLEKVGRLSLINWIVLLHLVNYPPPTLRLEVGASKVVVPNGTKFT